MLYTVQYSLTQSLIQSPSAHTIVLQQQQQQSNYSYND